MKDDEWENRGKIRRGVELGGLKRRKIPACQAGLP